MHRVLLFLSFPHLFLENFQWLAFLFLENKRVILKVLVNTIASLALAHLYLVSMCLSQCIESCLFGPQESHSGEPFPLSNSGASEDTELPFWDMFLNGPPLPFAIMY